jgi:hypothetical protein
MTLRVRLLLGYGYLVVLLLVATGSAMLGFLRLSAGIDTILEENVRSISAAMRMLESLERQDSATLAALIEGGGSGELLAEQQKELDEALAQARSNVTEEGEQEVLEAIVRDAAAYREAREALLASAPERPLAAYNSEVFPRFLTVKAGAFELLQLNYDAILQADRQARRSAIRNGAWLGLLVAVALTSLVMVSRGMQRQVLSRIAELRRGAAAVAASGPTRRLREQGADELAAIARQINAALDDRQRQAAALRSQLASERRLVLALLAGVAPGAAVYDLAGRLRAGDEGGREAVGRWIRDQGRRRLDDGEEVIEATVGDGDGPRIEVTLLSAGPGRPVAWLARARD